MSSVPAVDASILCLNFPWPYSNLFLNSCFGPSSWHNNLSLVGSTFTVAPLSNWNWLSCPLATIFADNFQQLEFTMSRNSTLTVKRYSSEEESPCITFTDFFYFLFLKGLDGFVHCFAHLTAKWLSSPHFLQLFPLAGHSRLLLPCLIP